MEIEANSQKLILDVYNQGPEAVVAFFGQLLAEIAKIDEMKQIIQKQEERIFTLERQIDKDSHNSNKPPSRDPAEKSHLLWHRICSKVRSNPFSE